MKKRKFLPLALTGALLLQTTALSAVQAQDLPTNEGTPVSVQQTPISFKDTKGHWAEAAIADLAERSIISGYKDGTFRPNENVTRAQFVRMIVNAMGYVPVKPTKQTFQDVGPNNWESSYVETAIAHGILIKNEWGNQFKSGTVTNREEMAVMVARALKLQSVNNPTTFKDAKEMKYPGLVEATAKRGILTGYNDQTFKPKVSLTRAQASRVVYNTIQSDIKATEEKDEPIKEQLTLKQDVLQIPQENVSDIIEISPDTNEFTIQKDSPILSELAVTSDSSTESPKNYITLNPTDDYPSGLAKEVIGSYSDDNGNTVLELTEPQKISELYQDLNIDLGETNLAEKAYFIPSNQVHASAKSTVKFPKVSTSITREGKNSDINVSFSGMEISIGSIGDHFKLSDLKGADSTDVATDTQMAIGLDGKLSIEDFYNTSKIQWKKGKYEFKAGVLKERMDLTSSIKLGSELSQVQASKLKELIKKKGLGAEQEVNLGTVVIPTEIPSINIYLPVKALMKVDISGKVTMSVSYGSSYNVKVEKDRLQKLVFKPVTDLNVQFGGQANIEASVAVSPNIYIRTFQMELLGFESEFGVKAGNSSTYEPTNTTPITCSNVYAEPYGEGNVALLAGLAFNGAQYLKLNLFNFDGDGLNLKFENNQCNVKNLQSTPAKLEIAPGKNAKIQVKGTINGKQVDLSNSIALKYETSNKNISVLNNQVSVSAASKAGEKATITATIGKEKLEIPVVVSSAAPSFLMNKKKSYQYYFYEEGVTYTYRSTVDGKDIWSTVYNYYDDVNEPGEPAVFFETSGGLYQSSLSKTEKTATALMLKYPIKVGTSWQTPTVYNNALDQKKIVAVNQTVQTPGYTFKNAVKVKVYNKKFGLNYYQYFVQNVGLVDQTSITADGEVEVALGLALME
ncbi:S-layer homology domain-containing protein [Priestia koreensis]|uniref:S-layer homology domain-containing protein n=1 Tax=Priestia koreensis TaxID=284581 RepID=UPI0034592E06